VFETILVPLDGSELSETALPVALEMARRFQARLLLVRAVESAAQGLVAAPPGFLETPAAAAANVEIAQKIDDEEEQEAREYLQAITDRLDADNVEALIVEDDPADAIVKTAQTSGATLIVMSSHGRSGLGRLVFGSVAQAVLGGRSVPVLLVKRGSD
jgi:nucleotide-binding universal stress UspA family protein